MENIKPNKDLLTLAEKIIDQNDKIIKMNGIIIENITKPPLQFDFYGVRHTPETTGPGLDEEADQPKEPPHD